MPEPEVIKQSVCYMCHESHPIKVHVQLKANVTHAILPGVVMVPYEWSGEADVNILIDDRKLDPISGYAPMKSQLCQVEKR